MELARWNSCGIIRTRISPRLTNTDKARDFRQFQLRIGKQILIGEHMEPWLAPQVLDALHDRCVSRCKRIGGGRHGLRCDTVQCLFLRGVNRSWIAREKNELGAWKLFVNGLDVVRIMSGFVEDNTGFGSGQMQV